MVSPADDWKDTDDGFRANDTFITVWKMRGESWNDGDKTEFEGHEVFIRDGRHGSPRGVATYEDPKRAWELAHLLTHFIDLTHPASSLMELSDPEAGEPIPINGVAEREPEQLLRDILGYYEFKLDDRVP